MAGHSQFKNIMRRKGKQDARRAKIFTRLIREITVSARCGLSDPAFNPRLRAAILAARAENVPRDKIEQAVRKGAGEIEGEHYEEVRYEGYGPGGVAFIVEAMTDNRNRTAADIRSIFSKHGGNLGETGSVGFMFCRRGVIAYPAERAGAEEIFEAALEAGAENCESAEAGHEVACAMEAFNAVRDALAEKFGEPESARLQWIPDTLAPVHADKAEAVLRLFDALDDCDDVQEVAANYDIDPALLEKLSA